jgi:hypothetical protein
LSVKLDKRNTTIDSQILKGNVSPSKVYQPQWINNQTRLNQTNVELMRSNLIKYIDLVAGSLFTNIKNDLNSIIDKSAGWVQINTSNGDIVGEIFNDYDNNKVAENKKYQATFGSYTEAAGNGQFVCGNANKVVEDALFIVGCGNPGYTITSHTEPQTGVTYYTKDDDSEIYEKFEGTTFEEGTVYYESNRQNALVINESGTVNILKDVTFDGDETFKGTVTFTDTVTFNSTVKFEELVNLAKGFNVTGNSEVRGNLEVGGNLEVNSDSKVNGKLTVTKAPTAKTHVVRKKELDDLRSEISGALHYIGKTTTELTNGSNTNPIPIYDAESGESKDINAVAGDVVIINGTQNEFIFDGNSWSDYSEYGNYVLTKTYEKLNKALFSDGETPEWNDDNDVPNAKSLQTQLEAKLKDETTNRETVDKNISGLETMPPQDYENSNEKLRLEINNINETLRYLIIDGGNAQDAISSGSTEVTEEGNDDYTD